jgi:hypothetical protein
MPSPRPLDTTPRRVTVPGPPVTDRGSAGAGRLKAWRALALGEGEGRLLVDGVARDVRPGRALEGYVVKAVGPRRVVLEGPAPDVGREGRGPGTVLAIMTFDAQGAARVRVVLESDPTPVVIPQPQQ